MQVLIYYQVIDSHFPLILIALLKDICVACQFATQLNCQDPILHIMQIRYSVSTTHNESQLLRGRIKRFMLLSVATALEKAHHNFIMSWRSDTPLNILPYYILPSPPVHSAQQIPKVYMPITYLQLELPPQEHLLQFSASSTCWHIKSSPGKEGTRIRN